MTRTSPMPPAAPPDGRALRRDRLIAAAASAGLALTWLALSWWHPTVTYHFGPALAAAAWPVLVRARLRHPARRRQALTAAGGGLGVALAALGVAMAARWLRGPTLIGAGSIPAEELVLAVLAAAWGWHVAMRRKRAWFLPAEPAQRPGSEPRAGEPGR